MQIIKDIACLRAHLKQYRQVRIGFVPTMGGLHQGHLALVEVLQRQVDVLVASIYVNPLQFGVSEDFKTYPRSFEQDAALLQARGVAVLFSPSHLSNMVPQSCFVSENKVCSDLEATFRPHFFQGVLTVVAQLFLAVQPDVAAFGYKDFQQLLAVRCMVAQLCFPIEIIAVETVRESDGLACSSRNAYLSTSQRCAAPQLFKVLSKIATVLPGLDSISAVQACVDQGRQDLVAQGWKVDYLSVRNAADLSQLHTCSNLASEKWVVLGAACLGNVRLLDNVMVKGG